MSYKKPKFNILIDKPPTSIMGVKINTSFRNMLKFEIALMRAKDDDETERVIYQGLELLFGDRAKHIEVPTLIDKFFKYYRLGEGIVHKSKEDIILESSDRPARAYCFDKDAETIFGSFKKIYGIDLLVEDLHWWTFRTLLFALPPEEEFMKRCYYRTVDISTIENKSEKERIQKLKRKYKLEEKDRRTVKEQDADLINSIQEKMNARIAKYGK